MAISLFIGAGAFAQAPTGWAAAGDKSPRTSWQPYPGGGPGGAVVPLQSAAVPPPAPKPTVAPPASGIGSRVVVYTKPAGEIQPVQATDAKPKNGTGDTPADKEKPKQPVVVPEPDRAQVMQLITDDELVNQMIERQYQKDLANWNKNKKPGDPPPKKPSSVRTDEFELTVGLQGTAVGMPNVVKPGYTPAQVTLEPSYVVHRRLFFEEKNSERYGWDLGFAQPFVSTAYFYKDVLLWPGHIMSNFKERYDTNAGKCLPGTPVAYYLYPPQLTIRGGLWETAAVLGVVFLLP